MAPPMRSARSASIVIRNLDPSIKQRLRVRAAGNGHLVEAEARHILRTALSSPGGGRPRRTSTTGCAPVSGGWADLDLPPREPARAPPRFD